MGRATLDALRQLLRSRPYSIVHAVINPDTTDLMVDSARFLLDEGVRYVGFGLNHEAAWTRLTWPCWRSTATRPAPCCPSWKTWPASACWPGRSDGVWERARYSSPLAAQSTTATYSSRLVGSMVTSGTSASSTSSGWGPNRTTRPLP